MIRKILIPAGCLLLLLFNACTPGLKTADLYGEWKYIRVEYPARPADNLAAEELEEQHPSIVFRADGRCIIRSRGKQLSEGRYTLEKNIIRYTETLPGGQTRKIPFLIKSLKADTLVFETMEQDATHITARRADQAP